MMGAEVVAIARGAEKLEIAKRAGASHVIDAESEDIRGQIKALTAEGRFQGIVLLALPPLMLGVLMVLNRPYIMTLFDYPVLLVGMLISMGIGAFWINKIVSFDF